MSEVAGSVGMEMASGRRGRGWSVCCFFFAKGGEICGCDLRGDGDGNGGPVGVGSSGA